MIVFIVPKNSGLKEYTKKALKLVSGKEIIKARAQDVPLWVEKLLPKSVVGLTGEDLYREYINSKWNSKLSIIKIIPWNDTSAIYRKPALCLIGPQNKTIDNFSGNVNIVINSKYKNTAKKYLNSLENRGLSFTKFYLNGNTEQSCSAGISDLAFEIVYSGKTLAENNLVVYEKVSESNYVIFGGKNARYL